MTGGALRNDGDCGRVERNALVEVVLANVNRGSDLRILDGRTGDWRRRSWADVVDGAEAVASRLVARQRSEVPDPVAIVGEPTFEVVATLLGAWMAGRASTLLPGPNRSGGLESWLVRTREKVESLGVTEVFASGTSLRTLESCVDGAAPEIRTTDLEQVSAWRAAPSGFTAVARSNTATAIHQGTAGSTGTSKSVELTAAAALANVRAVYERQGFRAEDDVLCSWLPLYHDMGLMMLLAGMLAGSPTWLAPTSAFARSPFDWLGWLSESGATVTAAPNFAYALLGRYARIAGDADLGALRIAINGGEPIDVEATERFGVELAQLGFDAGAISCSYGLAEATCALTMPMASSGLQSDEVVGPSDSVRRAALLGRPVDGVEIRIVPTDHRTDMDDVRAVGEIEFRSAAQMKGYHGEPSIEPGEWIATGDLGYLVDEQLVVCGRSKELITIAGRNIFPQEVERAAAVVAGVRPGAVVAVGGRSSGPRRDQLVVVAEYVGDDRPAARKEIMQRVAAECGITPGAVDFVDAGSLPKTTSGKLRRVEIAGRYR